MRLPGFNPLTALPLARRRVKRLLHRVRDILAEENSANRIMLENYARWAKGGSKDDLLMANAQLQESVRSLGAGFMLILPLSFLTFPLLLRLSERTGIRILPAWFDRLIQDLDEGEDPPKP